MTTPNENTSAPKDLFMFDQGTVDRIFRRAVEGLPRERLVFGSVPDMIRYGYHLHILQEAGLIEGAELEQIDQPWGGTSPFGVKETGHLTWKGHQLILDKRVKLSRVARGQSGGR